MMVRTEVQNALENQVVPILEPLDQTDERLRTIENILTHRRMD